MTGSNLSLQPAHRVKDIRYAVRDVVVLADQLRKSGKKMFYLNIGDPNLFDFAPPEALVEAAHQAMRANKNGYTSSDGLEEALAAISKENSQRGIKSIQYTWIGSGCSEVIDMALTALVNRGDNVLTPCPGYPLYSALLSKLEADNRPYYLNEENGFQPDLDDIAKKIDARTKAIVVINPNNPTGSVASRETLQAIVDLADRHNLLVIADEIYDKLLLDGQKHTPLGSLSERAAILSLNGLSKNYVLPGWRIGWGALSGPRERLADYIEGVKQLGRARLCANHPEQYAIAPALSGPQTHLDVMNKKLTQRRDLVLRLLGGIDGIDCKKPGGAFYAFPRLLKAPDDATWCRNLMQETGVVVVPGSGFGQKSGTQHFRIVFLPPPEILEEACTRIATFIKSQ